MLALAISAVAQPILTDNYLDRFIVVPEHNLLFCYIEKVGCTMFNNLFYGLQYNTPQPNPHWFANSPSSHKLSKEDLEHMLLNKTWHKAVFYREPLSRFLSGYRSKCEPGHDLDTHHCHTAFGSESATFVDAVKAIAKLDHELMDGRQHIDIHYQRQARFCGGLENTVQYYDTVEELKSSTSHDKISTLLRTIGVPEPKVSSLMQPLDAKTRHHTHASRSIRSYYTEAWLTNTVMSHYMKDYLLFGIKAPDWAIKHLTSRPRIANRETGG